MFCACIANIHRQTKVLLILLNYFKIQLITFKTKKTPAVGKIVQFFPAQARARLRVYNL